MDDYVVKLSDTTCAFCINDSGSEDLAIFGDALMSHYYIIFDHATSQVGFAPLVNSPTMKSAVFQGETPATSYDSTKATASTVSNPTKIVIIILLVLIIIAALLVGFYFV